MSILALREQIADVLMNVARNPCYEHYTPREAALFAADRIAELLRGEVDSTAVTFFANYREAEANNGTRYSMDVVCREFRETLEAL
jgi:hypothetical protein